MLLCTYAYHDFSVFNEQPSRRTFWLMACNTLKSPQKKVLTKRRNISSAHKPDGLGKKKEHASTSFWTCSSSPGRWSYTEEPPSSHADASSSKVCARKHLLYYYTKPFKILLGGWSHHLMLGCWHMSEYLSASSSPPITTEFRDLVG